MQYLKRYFRSRIGSHLQWLGHATGIMHLGARLQHVEGAIILMYHSVADGVQAPWIDPRNHVPADVFKEQIEFLVHQRRVTPMAELIVMLRQGNIPSAKHVVITFDDGYLDNLTVAAPILDRHGLKATLFLPTNYIDRGETQWVDQAYTAFKFRTIGKLVWGENAAPLFDLDDQKQHAAGYTAVCRSLLCATPVRRRILLNELFDKLQPSERPPRLTMNWEEVRTLLTKHHCFEIGGHTLEHTDLTSISDKEARTELAACRQRIKEELDILPRYFSFPYGRTSESLRRLVAESGFEAACGGDGLDPVIKATADPFRLPRVEAPRSMRRFDLLTSSANTGFWRKLGR